MKKNQTIIIISVFSIILLIGLVIGLFLLRTPQPFVNRATQAVCPAEGATCTWKSDETATSFKVEIIDQSTGQTILSRTTAEKIIRFTPIPNRKYTCKVTPINSCGEGPTASGHNTCIPQSTPTATPTPEPTSTPTPTVIMCQQPSTCRPAAECTADGGTSNGEQCEEPGTVCCIPQDSTPTPTYTPSPTHTSTPSPTETPVPTNTPTPSSTHTPTPTSTTVPTWTPAPTYTPYPTYTPNPSHTPTPYPTNTLYPSATPTDIIIVVNNTNTPTPTSAVQGTTVPTIPNAGVPVSLALLLIPIVLVGLGLIF